MTWSDRYYQNEATAAVHKCFEAHRSTLLNLSVGSGKTRCAVQIAKERRHLGRTLFLAHTEELVQQAMAAMAAGGLTVELERAESRASVRTLLTPSDVVVATVQTMRGKRLEVWPRDAFATVTVDECHLSIAQTYRTILDHFADAKVLGLSATPDRSDGLAMGLVYESVAYRYSMHQGITDGYLAPLVARRVEVGELSLKDVRTLAGELSAGDLEAAMATEGVLHAIASPLTELAGARPTLVFCPTVAVATELSRVLGAYVGGNRASVVSAKTPREERRERLAAFAAGDIQYMCNVAALTAGVDIPSISCLALVRPTKSRALLEQMIGRSTRLAPGKTNALVLDFRGKDAPIDLVGPEDVLAGKDLPDTVMDEVRKKLSKPGADHDELLDIIAQAKEAASQAEADKELARRRAHIVAVVPYAQHHIDLFSGLRQAAEIGAKTLRPAYGEGARASQAQRAMLERYGIAAAPETSLGSAGKALDELKRRGVPSFKQQQLLAKHGLPTNVSKEKASSIIDALAQSGWKRTAAVDAALAG